jgi:hypothetical protein
MAKLYPKLKPTLNWSEEELRQRGVRAVVAAMRLNKEHRRLSHENACCCQQTRVLREYLKEIRSLNETARELIKWRAGSPARNTKVRNTWINDGDSSKGI